jgi:hypothetical protein
MADASAWLTSVLLADMVRMLTLIFAVLFIVEVVIRLRGWFK